MQHGFRALRITSAVAAFLAGCTDTPMQLSPSVPARLEAITAVTLTAPVESNVKPAPIVRLLDSRGYPVPGVQIHFQTDDASIPVVIAWTNLGGMATIGTWTLGTRVGTHTVTATAIGLPPVVFTAIATSSPVDSSCFVSPSCGVAPRLAFMRDNAIYAINAEGTGVVRLTSGNAAHDSRPVWSPDHSRLAFRRWAPNAPWPNEHLCIMRFDGSEVRCGHVLVHGRPSWSPDGAELAFIGSTYEDASVTPARVRLYAMRTDDMATIRVITDNVGQSCSPSADVSWSAVGNKIAITSSGPSECGSIATINPDGTGQRTITRHHLGDNEWDFLQTLSWSPDGQKLLVSLVRFENPCWDECDTAIGLLNADGTGFTILSIASWQLGERVADPVWSPTGSLIAYTSSRGCSGGICHDDVSFISADGSHGAMIVANASMPSWR